MANRFWRWLPLVLALLLCCGSVYVLGFLQRDLCENAGGELQASVTSRTGAVCVRDGVVIHP